MDESAAKRLPSATGLRISQLAWRLLALTVDQVPDQGLASAGAAEATNADPMSPIAMKASVSVARRIATGPNHGWRTGGERLML